MPNSHRLTLSAVAALWAVGCIAAAAAHADSRQKNKNLWRNAAIASGAVAAYGLTHHKDTLTIAGAAGAIYSGQRYEDDRRSQAGHTNRSRNWYRGHGYRYHHDHGHHYGWRNHPERHHGRHEDDDDDD